MKTGTIDYHLGCAKQDGLNRVVFDNQPICLASLKLAREVVNCSYCSNKELN